MKVFTSLFIVSVLLVTACKNKTTKHNDEATDTNKTEQIATVEAEPTETPQEVEEILNQKVKITTEYGDMVLKLYDETPKHRDNFIKLIKEGFYKDLLFHRVIQSFMIQGGDPASKGAAPSVNLGSGGPGYTIPAEFNLKLVHKKGALAAARLGGPSNPAKESSGSQFYIVQGQPAHAQQLKAFSASKGFTYTQKQLETYATVGGTPQLDMDYTVFGEVIEGLEVIDKIAAVQISNSNRPVSDVKFNITLIEAEQE